MEGRSKGQADEKREGVRKKMKTEWPYGRAFRSYASWMLAAFMILRPLARCRGRASLHGGEGRGGVGVTTPG